MTDELKGDALARLRDTLTDIAHQHDITVLAARDIGSHAWQLAGPDSDYDVGFLYAQEPIAYATLGEYHPSIEHVAGAAIELTGWNITRFGELLTDSNPSALEFLHSPVRYRSLAETNYRTYIRRRLLDRGEPVGAIEDETPDAYIVRPQDADETITQIQTDDDRYTEAATDRTVKRNLYVIRAVLYARYIRETHAFPSLDFPAFLDANAERFESSLVAQTRTLIERKQQGEGDAIVGDMFGRDTVALPEQIDPATHNVRGIDHERVNTFIRTTLADPLS